MIRCITNRIESDIQYGNELTKAYGNQEISWLKSLRPQPKKGLHPGSIRKVDNPMKWMEEDEKEQSRKTAYSVH